jgi:hypothetical protein
MSDMKRREFITLIGGAAAWPLAARAQQGERMRRIGVLMPFTAGDPEAQTRNAVFAQSLGQLGWTVGGNLQIDYRFSGGEVDRVRQYAAELVAFAPDVIMTRRPEKISKRLSRIPGRQRAFRIAQSSHSAWWRPSLLAEFTDPAMPSAGFILCGAGSLSIRTYDHGARGQEVSRLRA